VNVNAYVSIVDDEITVKERKNAVEVGCGKGAIMDGSIENPEVYIDDGDFFLSGSVGSAFVSISFSVKDFLGAYFDDITKIIIDEMKKKLKFFESMKGILDE
jgi:hypothetical protein